MFFILFILGLCTINAEKYSIPYVDGGKCEHENQLHLINDYQYGYLSSPEHDFIGNRDRFNCTWLIRVEENNTVKAMLSYDFYQNINVDMYDGPSVESPRIASYGDDGIGSKRFQTKTNNLLIRYYGEGIYAFKSAFRLYFEQSLPFIEHCDQTNGTMIRCRNGLACIPITHRCDNIFDCSDGTDEEDCPNINQTFTNGCGWRKMNQMLDDDNDDTLQIVNGKISQPGAWPWIVSLRLVSHEPIGHTCGGTIINRQWILTAAHCMAEYSNITDWTVHAGKYRELIHDSTEVIRYISKSFVHPLFIGSRNEIDNDNLTWYDHNANDIALLKLNAPLPDRMDMIGSICLADEQYGLDEGLISYVIGWGTVSNMSNMDVLNEALVPIITNEKCRQWMIDFNIGPSMICAGWEAGGGDACQGDSGGPLFVQNIVTKRFDQIGIVSTGALCGEPKQAGIYTRIPSYTSWIRNHTNSQFET